MKKRRGKRREPYRISAIKPTGNSIAAGSLFFNYKKNFGSSGDLEKRTNLCIDLIHQDRSIDHMKGVNRKRDPAHRNFHSLVERKSVKRERGVFCLLYEEH